MESGPDFFLEVLCLALCSDDIETEKILNNVLTTYHEEVKNGSSLDDELTKFYIRIITELRTTKIDLNNDFEVNTLLLKFEQHPAIQKNPKILERLTFIVANRRSLSSDRITLLKSKIHKWVIWVHGNNNLKKLFRTSQKVISTSDVITQDALMNELLDRAKELTKIYEDNTNTDASIDFIDMTCPHSIKKGIVSYTKKRVDKGFTTGLQGLNDMFGSSQGPVPGEFIGFAALSHHYKSGLLMDIARWIAMLNRPRSTNGKKNAIVFVSLENEIYENMMMMFRSAYINHYGKAPDNLSDTELQDEIRKLFSQNGFTLLIYRKEGDLFGYEEWRKLHDDLHSEYNIVASILDYLGLMRLDDNSDNPAKQRQALICKIKNFANRTGILVATGFQLDTEAERIAASGVTHVVKKFGAVHLADCKAAKRELDFLAFLHLEKNQQGQVFLTIAWAKHKYQVTGDFHKYCAYPFTDTNGILDDINGPRQDVKDIYNAAPTNNDKDIKASLF
jgi:hypothetical protein